MDSIYNDFQDWANYVDWMEARRIAEESAQAALYDGNMELLECGEICEANDGIMDYELGGEG